MIKVRWVVRKLGYYVGNVANREEATERVLQYWDDKSGWLDVPEESDSE